MPLVDLITQHEMAIRLSFFFGILLIMALWELVAPRRQLKVSKLMRWTNNLGLVFLNSIVLRLLFPAAAVGVAIFVESNSWGLLNYYRPAFPWAVVLSIIVLDFIIYLQHVLMHAAPSLWRVHRVHHADLDYDVTTGAALSSDRDYCLHADQVCRHPCTGASYSGGGNFRDHIECSGHVQSWQRTFATITGSCIAANNSNA